MADTGNDDVAVVVVVGDIGGDDFSDDDATTVHGCDDDGDEELLPLEMDTTDPAKILTTQVRDKVWQNLHPPHAQCDQIWRFFVTLAKF